MTAIEERTITPAPKTIDELKKLSRWTVFIMALDNRFKDSSPDIKKEVELIVDSCKESL